MFGFFRRKQIADDPTNIGNLLLEFGWITKDQLQAVTELQQGKQKGSRMGEIFCKLDLITPDQLEEALWCQKIRRGKGSQRDVTDLAFARYSRQQDQIAASYSEVTLLAQQVALKVK